jgi:hypothetical protein
LGWGGSKGRSNSQLNGLNGLNGVRVNIGIGVSTIINRGIINGGGGGGSSGGGAGGIPPRASSRFGGNGGFGIENLGTITTLSNLQGISSTIINVNGISAYSIPLYITGANPVNYNIIIDDNTGRYGQLYRKSLNTNPIFQIDSSSTINGLNTIGSSKVYNNISSNVTFSNTSGSQNIGTKSYNWTISGTTLTVTLSGFVCYNKDTEILTKINNIEQYIKIQDLIPGNLIKTYLHGFKPLKYLLKTNVTSGNQELNSMYLIKKNNKINLKKDLIISGGHYILVNEIDKSIQDKRTFYNRKLKIDDKFCLLACDYDEAIKLNENEKYEIYHIILEGNNERYGMTTS